MIALFYSVLLCFCFEVMMLTQPYHIEPVFLIVTIVMMTLNAAVALAIVDLAFTRYQVASLDRVSHSSPRLHSLWVSNLVSKLAMKQCRPPLLSCLCCDAIALLNQLRSSQHSQ
jgi:hypothetical protein